GTVRQILPRALAPLRAGKRFYRADGDRWAAPVLRNGGIASQKSFTVEIGFAPGKEAGIVGVTIKLQHQARLARGLVQERLNVGIRPAFEIRNVDQVQV